MPCRAFPSPRVAGLAFGLSLASALALASPAAAVILGSLAPPDLGGCGNCNTVQWKSAPGEPSYEVPPGKWRIKSWSTQGGGTAAGKARLRVYRPTGTKRQLRLVKQSDFGKVPVNGRPVFATSLTVRGGDLIGLYTLDNLSSGYSTGLTKDVFWAVACASNVGDLVGAGTGCKPGVLKASRVNIEAKLSKL
jgi:hypothetical protein